MFSNGNDLLRCPQEQHASLHQIQTVFDKKANASKLKEQQYVYVQQPKSDHQGSQVLFTDYRWIGPYIVEKP